MSRATEMRWAIQNVLGLAIQPYDQAFAELDGVLDTLDEIEDAEALEYVRQFFLPQEENVGQERQAADRVAQAIRWSMAHYGEIVPWMIRAGIPSVPTDARDA